MKAAVVGLGQFGWSVAVLFAELGAEVIAIDSEMDLVDRIKDKVSLAVRLDASSEEALEAQGVADADVLIAAIGRNFEAQVLLVVHAKRLGVRRVIARATTEDHQRVLEAVGADEVLNPEQSAGRQLVNRLMVPDITHYLELAEGFGVMEVAAPPGSIGKTLLELELPRRYRIQIAAIRRGPKEGGEVLPVPAAETRIEEGDALAMVGGDLAIAQFLADHEGGAGS